jgi:phage terminase large subunit-like protein
LQREIIDSPAKRKVVCAGRRGGKTVLAAYMAVDALMQGRRVLLSSTSQDQADVFWEYITDWLSPLLVSGHLYKNEVKRIVRLGAGQVQVKTGRHPDALRGGMADLLVLDECAYLDPDAWRKVGAPMLADNDGTAVFISTPSRRNWFFELYNTAVADDTGRWAAWHFTTHANPYLPQTALDALIADMTQDDYQQEIEARFLEGQGSVFRYVDERCTADRRAPYPGRFVMGLDWAQAKDFTAMIVLDMQTSTVVDMDRFNGIDWALQRGRVRAMFDKWQLSEIVAESNSIGGPNIEALQREGLPVRAFETTGTSKPPLIESLVLAFDRGEITVLDDPVMKGELMAYERTVTATGRSQYSAPEGLHDDCVMALALAWHGVVGCDRLEITTAPDWLADWRG